MYSVLIQRFESRLVEGDDDFPRRMGGSLTSTYCVAFWRTLVSGMPELLAFYWLTILIQIQHGRYWNSLENIREKCRPGNIRENPAISSIHQTNYGWRASTQKRWCQSKMNMLVTMQSSSTKRSGIESRPVRRSASFPRKLYLIRSGNNLGPCAEASFYYLVTSAGPLPTLIVRQWLRAHCSTRSFF